MRFIFPFILLFVGLFQTNAQNFSFGPKAGINFSTLKSDDFDFGFKGRTGFHIGGFADYQFSNWFALRGELLFIRKGAKLEQEIIEFDTHGNPVAGQNSSFDLIADLDYVSLAVLAKTNYKGIYLFAGPQAALIVSAKERIEEGEFSGYEKDISDEFKNFDFGLALGLGYDFKFGLSVQGKYYLGLLNINDINLVDAELVDDGVVLEYPEVKNRGFQVSIGYRL